jgi:dTDP-4-dehydrorhamnose 3,5-epimerase
VLVFSYKVGNYYSPESDCGIAAHDTDLNIDWELAVKGQILSEKDMQQPSFLELQSPF